MRMPCRVVRLEELPAAQQPPSREGDVAEDLYEIGVAFDLDWSEGNDDLLEFLERVQNRAIGNPRLHIECYDGRAGWTLNSLKEDEMAALERKCTACGSETLVYLEWTVRGFPAFTVPARNDASERRHLLSGANVPEYLLCASCGLINLYASPALMEEVGKKLQAQ